MQPYSKMPFNKINATPTIKINSTKYTCNDSANSIVEDTVETQATECHEETFVNNSLLIYEVSIKLKKVDNV